MSEPLLLTPEEVRELTGRTYPKHQIDWLTAMKWKFEVGADGHPKIARAYFNDRMGVKPPRRKGPRLAGLAA